MLLAGAQVLGMLYLHEEACHVLKPWSQEATKDRGGGHEGHGARCPRICNFQDEILGVWTRLDLTLAPGLLFPASPALPWIIMMWLGTGTCCCGGPGKAVFNVGCEGALGLCSGFWVGSKWRSGFCFPLSRQLETLFTLKVI